MRDPVPKITWGTVEENVQCQCTNAPYTCAHTPLQHMVIITIDKTPFLMKVTVHLLNVFTCITLCLHIHKVYV